jgi:DNA (cytosine-5)-methyltransferase 1
VDNTEQLTCLSLCTGVRGLDRGVERVTGPLRTIAYVEIEAALIENLVVGMEAGELAPAPIWSNLKTFPWKAFHKKIFFLIGGYPCQPFSNAGKRKGKDDPRHLWPHIERGIRAVRPVCCFFENVYGHLSLGFDQVAESLRAMGYAVEAGVYTASEVGASHKRARVFILAILADAKDHVGGLYERSWKLGETKNDVIWTGKDVADSFSDGTGADSGSVVYQGGQTQGPEQRQEWNEIQRQWGRPDVGNSGTDVADPDGGNGSRSAGRTKQTGGAEFTGIRPKPNQLDHTTDFRQQGERDHRKPAEAADAGFILPSADRWPAGPGQSQYDWEPPRTIEPRMGCYVDGYNFREDLLRALGNGVVEETAELAFRTLLDKHFED